MAFIVVTGGEGFMPSGMTKNGTLKMSATWTDVASWTADTTGYPGSNLSGNGVRVQGGNGNATITVNLPFSGGTNAPTQQARIMVNNVFLVNGPQVPTANSGTLTATATGVTLADGDVVTVQAMCTAQFTNWESTISAGTGTYVRIT
ncbi:hypothetical protein ACWDOP_30725 [Nocardia sp. NPDC003693]